MEEVKIGIGTKLKSFMIQCVRVWHVLRKPTHDEYKAIAKVSLLGIAVIGALGFVIADVMKFFGKVF
jgi:protein translocase SEC61 complex gamma subunit